MPAAPPALPLFRARSVEELVAAALALGARDVAGWSDAEQAVADGLGAADRDRAPDVAAHCRAGVRHGLDPLGDTFCELRSPEERRPQGATYTPAPLVEAMLGWAKRWGPPARVVDPGAGSARFLVAAGRAFPDAALVGAELDPVAATLGRGHLAAAGLADRAAVWVGDYRALELPPVEGPTLFLGNPPYVRHHLLGAGWKTWLAETAAAHGLKASKLAGLHVHFFLATLEHARPGDAGVLVTAAEWLDVNYGRLVRDLLTGPLGAESVHVVAPEALPFDDAQTTAVVTAFEVGSRHETVGLRAVETAADLGDLRSSVRLHRDRLVAAERWTPLLRTAREAPEGFVELGELCRVHRGQVTGMNSVWVVGAEYDALPASVLFRSVTRARELFAADGVLDDASTLRHVVDLPADLDALDGDEGGAVRRFLDEAERRGARDSYTARHRKAWWSVGLREPAPILATYMARRPPAFVRNPAEARHINIAHGLYPRDPLSPDALGTLAEYLSQATSTGQGRTYAGGLTKFEPKEMERLAVPTPDLLATVPVADLLAA